MTRHGLGGSMTLKNYPFRGSMFVKTGGSMTLKNTPLQGVHVSGKSHSGVCLTSQGRATPARS